jgi:hypothetical protein
LTKKLIRISLVSLRGDLFCDGGRHQIFKTSELSRILTYPLVLKMPLRYDHLKDLPNLIKKQHMKKIVEIREYINELQTKLQECEAMEQYFERNSLFELKTITQQKKRKLKRKLTKLIDSSIFYCDRKLQLHSEIVTGLMDVSLILECIKYRAKEDNLIVYN